MGVVIGAIFVVGVVFDLSVLVANPLDLRGRVLGVAASLALSALGVFSLLTYRKDAYRVNRVAVGPTGFYPPFKPKKNPTKGDWFVPYKEIAAMEAVDARMGDFVPAHDVTLRDGLPFQVNAMDLLVYVGEAEVRRYARLLAVIQEEVTKPENQEAASKGEDIIIPRERFEEAMNPGRRRHG